MSLLAHAGGAGWDEVLVVCVPFVVTVGIFFAGIRRATVRADEHAGSRP